MAKLYREQERYAEAEPLFQRGLAIREQQFEPMHPSTADSLYNLAVLYDKQGKCVEAGSLYQQALAICKQKLGPNHPTTKIIEQKYSLFLQSLLRFYGKYGTRSYSYRGSSLTPEAALR